MGKDKNVLYFIRENIVDMRGEIKINKKKGWRVFFMFVIGGIRWNLGLFKLEVDGWKLGEKIVVKGYCLLYLIKWVIMEK